MSIDSIFGGVLVVSTLQVIPGQSISHYRLLESIGAGGMSAVYKAEDVKLGRFVALKFLSDEVAHDRHCRLSGVGAG